MIDKLDRKLSSASLCVLYDNDQALISIMNVCDGVDTGKAMKEDRLFFIDCHPAMMDFIGMSYIEIKKKKDEKRKRSK